MPTSETRTQASMTMPLSRTRYRTSMRLVPPESRSTGILFSLVFSLVPGPAPLPLSFLRERQRRDLFFQEADLLSQRLVLERQPPGGDRQVRVVPPPVQPDLFRLVDRADEQA